MSDSSLQEALEEMSAAEEFLDYFGIAYDPAVVHVNRLHVLQRFHDYLEQQKPAMPADEPGRREHYRALLARAYADFVHSDALSEKVFKVFRMHEPKTVFVPISEIMR